MRTVDHRTHAPLCLVLLLLPLGALAQQPVVSDRMQGTDVIVRSVTLRGTVVSGFVANQSKDIVQDVQLLIKYTWLWKNERTPGTNSPGRSDYYTLKEEIPPGSAVAFEHQPSPRLPIDRTDGRFLAQVEVVGFTQVTQ